MADVNVYTKKDFIPGYLSVMVSLLFLGLRPSSAIPSMAVGGLKLFFKGQFAQHI